ncbi:MAG: MATE family efflux transporter [Proteobacteria bacterium]|nr:MATE family efflux transporter [Pseudomonadota bacterium]
MSSPTSHPLRREARRLLTLALPVMGAQLGTMLMGAVDTAMVGRISVEALAAASIANALAFASLLLVQGLVLGIDPIVTQAHGAGRGGVAGLALQRGLLLGVAACVPLSALWWYTTPVLIALGQDPALAEQATLYLRIQIPSLPFFVGFVTLRAYLQGREWVRPALVVVIAANVFNAVANWALIFGHLGSPALGLVGAGIATTLTRALMLALLVLAVRVLELHGDIWRWFGPELWERRALAQLAAFGVPVAIQMSLEVWAFSAATFLAGRLGAIDLAAHTIALNLAALSFMLPLGLSQASVTRVGNLLGAGRSDDAQRAAWVSIALGAAVMGAAALLFIAGRSWLPRIFTDEAGVVALCASILPIAAAFQVFDGTQVVGCGVLRGMGRTRPAAWFNLIGYWVLGLPLAAWLALSLDFGLAGVWWGLCLGLAVVAACLVLWIRVRGPNRVEALSL